MRLPIGFALVFWPAFAAGQNTGVVFGTVRGSAGLPLRGAHVTAMGTSIGSSVDSLGLYRIEVPAGDSVRIRVLAIGHAPGQATVTVPAGDSVRVDFQLNVTATVIDDFVVTRVWDGVGGSVADSTGEPLANVLIRIDGTTLTAATDDKGRFRFTRVPPGTYRLTASRIGFRPYMRDITVDGDGNAFLEIVLTRAPGVLLPSVVVTAAKRSQLLDEAVTSVAEVSAEQLDRRAVLTVDEAVDKAPGVQLLNGQINVRGSSGYAQGLGSRVLLLLDGVPANQGDRGGINWDVLPVDAIERVEIVKGAGSALYGSSAMGGVVNLITADPPPGLHGRARASLSTFANPPHDIWAFRDFTGSQSGFDGMVSFGGDEFRWEARGGGWHSDGYREHNSADQWHAGARTVWIASPTTRVDLSGSWASNQYQTALLWCTQGRCEDGGQEYQPFKVDTSGVGDHTRSDKGFLSVAFRSTPRADFAWRARGSFFHTHFVDFHRARDDESFADRLGAEIQSELHPTPDRVVTMGGELGLAYINSNIFSGDTGNVYRGRSQTEFAAYAESEQRWGNARITLGARVDAIGVDGGSFSAVPSPRLGAVLPTGVGVLRASLGRGFRAPSLAELYVSTFVQGLRVIPNPNLKPETGWSAEVGDAFPFGGDRGGWTGYLDAAVFWNEARDLIEPQIVSGGTQIQFQNVTAARMIGLDLALTTQPPILSSNQGRALTGTLSYTFLSATDLTQDRALAFRPKHLLTVSADFERGRFSAGSDYRYMSRMARVEIFEGDPRVAASVLDVRAGVRVGVLSLSVKVNNVLNYIYALVPRTLAPPRTVSLTVTSSY